MSVRLIHPEGVARVDVHHQVSIAQGARIITMAGQVSWDADAQLVGRGDLAAQTEQAYLNVAASSARRAAHQLGVDFQHPGTYIGVTSLFDPDYLIEVVGTAVVD